MILLVFLIFIVFLIIYGPKKAFSFVGTIFFLYLLFLFLRLSFPVILIIGLLFIIWNSLGKDKSKEKQKFEYRFYREWEDFIRDDFSNYNSNFNTSRKIESLDKYYMILGINKDTPNQDIKKKYKELVKKYHPDRHQEKSSDEIKNYENKLKEISEAYEIISENH